MNKKDIQRCRDRNPGAITFFKENARYKAYEIDAQQVYSILRNRPIEKLGAIAELDIKPEVLDEIIPRLIRAGKRVAIFGEDRCLGDIVGVG